MSLNTVTIAAGESLSSPIDLTQQRGFFGTPASFGNRVTALLLPPSSNWTTADITFAVSINGEDFYPLFNDDDTEYTISFSAGSTAKGVYVDITKMAAWQYVKIRSGTSGTPVNQAAARTLYALTHLV